MLGEVVAVDNTVGNIGIAPASHARVVSQWLESGDYGTPEAIVSATAVMAPGDVLLLEAQTAPRGSRSYAPVEVEPAVYDAIGKAVDKGIVVVEAAGNGAQDLDAFETRDGRRVLARASPDFRDSGAILVAAASSSTPHERCDFSSFGSRIDCYAWGDNIDTTGDGWQGTSLTEYTIDFGGTSGAAPIIAGAAILLQAISRAKLGRILSPAELRELVASPTHGTASKAGQERIGCMPDLRRLAMALA